MADYSKMSDAELLSLVKPPAAQSVDYSKMSDEDLLKAVNGPSVVADVAKSAGVGIGKGLIQGAGAAGDLRSMVSSGTDWAGEKLGISPETIKTVKNVASGAAKMTPFTRALAIGPTSEEIQKKIEGATGEFHKPETTAGKYAETIGEMVPGALLSGPGGGVRALAIKAAKFAVLPGVASEAAGEATAGTKAEPYARVAAALLGTAAPGIGRKIITPFESSPEIRQAVGTLADSGVDSLTAGQRTQSKLLQSMERRIGNTAGTGFAADRIAGEGERQLTREVMGRAGAPGEVATAENLQANYDRLGQNFRGLSARNSIVPDQQLVHDIGHTAQRYDLVLDANQRELFHRNVNSIVDRIVTTGGMTGEEYQIARSQLGAKAQSLKATDPEAARAFRGLRDDLDSAMRRSIQAHGNPADLRAWDETRAQYGVLKDIEKAKPTKGRRVAEGVLDPQRLNSSISSGPNRGMSARGQLPLSDVAQAATSVMTKPGHVMEQHPSLSGAVMAIPNTIAGRLMMSRPAQAYLGNQAIAGPAVGDARLAAIAAALTQGRRQHAP